MPKVKRDTTADRRNLGHFVNLFGKPAMPRTCAACIRNRTECKVHVRSGRCGACNLRGSVCNIRITKNEWDRLRSERERLLREIENAREAQEAAQRAQAAAQKAMNDAFREELQLRQKMTKLETEAEEAIAVEEANISAAEAQEVLDLPPSTGLAMSPHTWTALDGLDDQFWDDSPSLPWVTSALPVDLGERGSGDGTPVSG
jgi:hypothetical protein